MPTRTRLDRDRPCGACGAPWAITERSVDVAEHDEPTGWAPVRSGCSCGSATHDLDAYNDELQRRREQ